VALLESQVPDPLPDLIAALATAVQKGRIGAKIESGTDD
jgi:hypothetical protein